MRLVGIVPWYDESPAMLAACVGSLARAGVTHVVAVDGAYALYPGGKRSSAWDQHDAIRGACVGAGVGLTLHVPEDVWHGNEVGKRSFCLRLAEQVTSADDWYFVMDADQVVTTSLGLLETLEDNADWDVAEVRFHDTDTDSLCGYPVRCLFRAIRGLHVQGTHRTYATPSGKRFSWNAELGSALDLSFVEVEHLVTGRSRERVSARDAYYERRDRLGIEREGVPA